MVNGELRAAKLATTGESGAGAVRFALSRSDTEGKLGELAPFLRLP
jgi:hypothetical protein